MCDLCVRFRRGCWQIVRADDDVLLDQVTAKEARAMVRELKQIGESRVSARRCPTRYLVNGPEALRVLPCQMFARCDHHADGATSHPVLGVVPACRRCATTLGVPFIDALLTVEVYAA
jgi:hypothetical protein